MSNTHILLVEDDFPGAESIQASLRSLGYMVPMIAQSREEALRQVAETFPDLVLMNIHLEHEMEGIEAAEQIRACFDIPVVYLTAHDDEEILQQARISEPFGYLLKPFNLRELHSIIEIALYKHETEKKLKESEARFRSIVQDQLELIWRYLPDGTLTFVNDACCWYFGQEPEGLIGQCFFRFIPDEDQQEVRNRIASLRLGNPVVEMEHRIILSEHTIRWHHWTNRIIWDDQGNVVEYQGTGQDITERKQMEEELRRYREHLEELVEVRTAELSKTNKQLQREIVERKQVEQTLAEEHNLLQTLLYNLPDYIYVKDRESRFLLANKASMQGLGVTTLDELIGKTDFDFFPAELSEQYSADERAIFESGQPLINREERNINLTTGITNWMLTTKVPFRDIQGNISGIVGIGRNITERKQVEEALQESQRRYELASTAGQVGVWDWDLKTNEIYIDPNLKAILGYADHEIRNHLDDWGKLVHPDDAKEVTAKATAHLEGRTSEYEVVHRMLHKDGSIRWFLARGTAIRDENGLAYRMVGTDSDITDRKRMEEALRESEERFRTIFETARDAIFIKDRMLKYIQVNPAMEKLFNTAAADLIRQTDEDLFGKEAGAHIRQVDSRVLQGEIVEEEHTKPVKGESKTFHIIKVPMHGKTGEITGLCGIARDITDRKRAEQALRASEQQYRLLAESVAEGVVILQERTLVFVNDVLCSMLGYPPDQLLQIDPVEVFRDDYKEFVRKRLELIAKGNTDTEQHWQAPCVTGDGREIWIETCHSFIEWKRKPAILVTVRNITERKLREIAIEEEKNRLKQVNIALRSTIKDRYKFGDIVGKSPVMQDIYELIVKASAADVNVVIYGESGTGKELIARTIHQKSRRHERAFVPVNCGAIPDMLFEREFFGHRKGAFTGAYADKPGFFDLAHSGTLFLDEVSEISPHMQVKLLRALEDGEYTPVGSNTAQKADVRIIAATNKNLENLIQQGLIREDIFYRIHVLAITVPPLRDRKEDIPLLVDHFLEHYGYDKKQQVLPGDILEQLYTYHWPGNIRELQNVLHRYLTIGRLDFRSINNLETEGNGNGADREPSQESTRLREAVEDFEKQFIISTLEKHHWHKSKAATVLGIPRRTLHRKLKKLGIK